MKKFKLIHELEHTQKTKISPNSTKYQQYELQINNNIQCIWIPLRETKLFEFELQNVETLTKETLQLLLRKYRGIKNI